MKDQTRFNSRSARLMSLLCGGREARPPFLEPWFCMDAMLRDDFGDDRVAMAQSLGMSAIRLPGVSVEVHFVAQTDTMEQTGRTYAGGALRDIEQLASRPEPDWDRQLEQIMPLRRRCADAGLACWLVLPWCFHAVATSMGLEYLALAVYDRPDFVRQAMAWCEQRNRRGIEKVIAAARPDFVLIDGDCAYRSGTMVSPAMLRDLCLAQTRLTLEALRKQDIPYMFHSDGKLDDVIPLLVELGVAAVHGCEAQANDLAHLVDCFGDQIVLCGNMDVVFLTRATPAQVTAATRNMLDVGSRRHRFVAGCNTSPQDHIPRANYRAMAAAIDAYRPDERD